MTYFVSLHYNEGIAPEAGSPSNNAASSPGPGKFSKCYASSYFQNLYSCSEILYENRREQIKYSQNYI